MAAFVIEKNDAGKFRFNLRAGNNQIILTSETYEAKGGALSGIASVRRSSQKDARFIRKTAKDGSPYFVLTATNGETIGKSEMYSSTAAMEKGIASVKNIAPDAGIVDKT